MELWERQRNMESSRNMPILSLLVFKECKVEPVAVFHLAVISLPDHGGFHLKDTIHE